MKMEIILVAVFLVSMVVGYKLINNVPSLLHTPLMSGMNALSGVTVLGAISSTVIAVRADSPILGYIFGALAIILAMINVVGGFGVTGRMLKMFKKKDKGGNKE
ncbi:MAG: NAD(P) transhydrogenase subunit alpha [Clostridia bacterium]|nr:NAD(P) transhydrogenase subunit alpha [Candidatus Limimonas egerieequi]MCQ2488930.1 NAD(P) transhydrogenase subunit alpha [Clostridia bacterium]